MINISNVNYHLFPLLLLQDDHGGLQVWSYNLIKRMDVPLTGPGVFVCTIGKAAKLASAGYFCATLHRVTVVSRWCRPYDDGGGGMCGGMGGGSDKQYSVLFF